MRYWNRQLRKTAKWTLNVLTRTVRLFGIALIFPKWAYGIEPFTDVRRLARLWKYPLETVFDVGANVGDTTIAILNQIPLARIYCFEPHPATFSKLVKRVQAEPRVQPVNVAFSLTAGSAEMIEYEKSTINSLTPYAHYAKRFGLKGRAVSVQTTTVDEFCAEKDITRIDLLKIDTEGFDLVVLESCRGMLEKRAIGFIYVEFNELQPKDGTFGGALVPFDNLLRPFGYRFMTSYMDYIVTDGEIFSVSNALFARRPDLD